MRITLVHPYRHHSYKSCISISKVNSNFQAILGYYNKHSEVFKFFFNKDVYLKSKGYYEEEINAYVTTSRIASLLFLYSKFNRKYDVLYRAYFEKYAINKLKDSDVVYVMQDYCQKVIDYATNEDKLLIYDNIMPCGYPQRNMLLEECNYLNYKSSFVDEIFPISKIEQNYENIKNSSLVINASKASFSIAEEALKNIDSNARNVIIPYGSNFSYFNDESFEDYIAKKLSSVDDRKLKILYVGSLSIMKGTHYLINAIEKTQNMDIEYGIVGVANKEEDKAFVNKLLKFENVKYYGHIAHKEMHKIYKEYDVFLFTSLIEGFGMVTLEAMSFGLPCIVNEFCSSIITDKYDGIIIEGRNERAIIDSMAFLLKNKEELMTYSVNAYNTSKKFSWTQYSERLSSEIERLCSSHNS